MPVGHAVKPQRHWTDNPGVKSACLETVSLECQRSAAKMEGMNYYSTTLTEGATGKKCR